MSSPKRLKGCFVVTVSWLFLSQIGSPFHLEPFFRIVTTTVFSSAIPVISPVYLSMSIVFFLINSHT